jgi:putative copper resistance protein D
VSRGGPLGGARVRWAAGIGALLIAAAVCVAALRYGGSAASAAGDSFGIDPGLTPWLLPLSRLAMQAFSIVTIGCLLAAAFFYPGDRPSGGPPSGGPPSGGPLVVGAAGVRWLRVATWTALGWAAAAATTACLTVADLLGVPAAEALTVRNLETGWDVESGRVLILVLVLAVAVAIGSQLARSVTAVAGVAVLAVGAVLPPGFAGHAATAASHEVTISAILLHVVGAVLWIAGLLGLLLRATSGSRAELAGAVRRFSALAGFCFALTGITGVLSALLRIANWSSLASGWGALLALKLTALVVLGGFGWWHRRISIPALAGGRPRIFARIAWIEIAVLAATFGLAGALARTPAPGSGKLSDLILRTNAMRAALDWLPDPAVTTLAVLAIGGYLVGIRRLAEPWPARRTAAWIAGWLLTLVAMDIKLTRSGTELLALTDRLQHLALLAVIPVLLVAGGGIRLALRTVRPSADPGILGPLEWIALARGSDLAESLRHPAMAVTAYATTIYLAYLSITNSYVLTSHAGHLGVAAAMVAGGSLLATRIAAPGRVAVRVAMGGSAVALLGLLLGAVALSAPLPSWITSAPPQPMADSTFTTAWVAVTSMVVLAVWVLGRPPLRSRPLAESPLPDGSPPYERRHERQTL